MVSQLQAVRSGENTKKLKVCGSLLCSVPYQPVSLPAIEWTTNPCCLVEQPVWESFTHGQGLVPMGPTSGSPHLLWEAAVRDAASARVPGKARV